MSVIRMNPAQLGAAIRRDAREFPKELKQGLRNGARRGRALLVRETPNYLGQMRAGWGDHATPDGAEIKNTAPHAGIVEKGARPHKVSAEGREEITVYVQRQAQVDRKTAERIAGGYIKKLEREGQKGQEIVGHNLNRLHEYALAEAARLVGNHHRTGGR